MSIFDYINEAIMDEEVWRLLNWLGSHFWQLSATALLFITFPVLLMWNFKHNKYESTKAPVAIAIAGLILAAIMSVWTGKLGPLLITTVAVTIGYVLTWLAYYAWKITGVTAYFDGDEPAKRNAPFNERREPSFNSAAGKLEPGAKPRGCYSNPQAA